MLADGPPPSTSASLSSSPCPRASSTPMAAQIILMSSQLTNFIDSSVLVLNTYANRLGAGSWADVAVWHQTSPTAMMNSRHSARLGTRGNATRR